MTRFSQKTRLKASSAQMARGVMSLYKPSAPEAKVRAKAKSLGRRTHGKNILTTVMQWIRPVQAIKATAGNAIYGIRMYKGLRPYWTRGASAKEAAREFGRGFKDDLGIDGFFHPIARQVFAMVPKAGWRRVLSHELAHAMVPSRNSFATANAMGQYFDFLGKASREGFDANGKMLELGQKTLDKERQASVERAFRNTPATIAQKALMMEHIALPFSTSFAESGRKLGNSAFYVETKTGKPCSGLFFIREVSKGKPFEQAMREIEAGKFDAEIGEWRRKNPALARFIGKSIAGLLEQK